ncbi:MAG: hypothetical protein LBT97_03335 [Planctomycetota bacterium]|jgi:predicted DNA-binding transcriptional regulator AlpA|nr:hypothetical protein [Planctomycetota bacterium]
MSELCCSETTDATPYITLGRYRPEDCITKQELAAALKVRDRTIQRMIDRFQIPPPVQLGSRKVWIAGRVLDWLNREMKRNEEAAAKDAKRLASQ